MGGKLNESANSLIWCRVAGESGEKLLWKINKRKLLFFFAVVIYLIFWLQENCIVISLVLLGDLLLLNIKRIKAKSFTNFRFDLK